MGGHSHWSTIKRQKASQDAKRGQLFTKLAREVAVAAREAGPDPDMNPRLRSAIQSARTANMPKENIKRAIDKSQIGADSSYENIRYEGFGPNKIAVIVEALTDNKNRTASTIRTIFQKNGGSLGTSGSASHNFLQLGVIKIDKKEVSEEKIFELALNAGAKECFLNGDFHEIHCNKSEIYNIKKELEKKINNFVSTEIEWMPINNLKISEKLKHDTLKFLESLEDLDDVQNVYTNLIF